MTPRNVAYRYCDELQAWANQGIVDVRRVLRHRVDVVTYVQDPAVHRGLTPRTS